MFLVNGYKKERSAVLSRLINECRVAVICHNEDMMGKQEMHTSFLSSIVPLDEGVALGFDVLVRLVALVDNGELCFALRIGDPTDRFKEVN
jgi:hypothetical protein